MSQLKIDYSEFEIAMLKTISEHFPFSIAEVSALYDRLKSFDKTKEMCEYALIFGYSDLLAAYVNFNDEFAVNRVV